MDFNKTVMTMLEYFGTHQEQELLGALLQALGEGIAAASVVTHTAEGQDKLLDVLFEDIREDAHSRYKAYEAFLAMDDTTKMRGMH